MCVITHPELARWPNDREEEEEEEELNQKAGEPKRISVKGKGFDASFLFSNHPGIRQGSQ